MTTKKTIETLKTLVESYKMDEEAEKELGRKIDLLKAEQRQLKDKRMGKGTLIRLLGVVKPQKDYYTIRDEQHALINEAKEKGVTWRNSDELKAKLKAIEETGNELTYSPIKKRTWICNHYNGYNGELYQFKLAFRLLSGFWEADFDEGFYNDYIVSVNERPELKKYKWEIKTRVPDMQKYHGTVETIIKCKDFNEVGEKINKAFEEVEKQFKEQQADIYKKIGFIFDLNTIESEMELPFKTGKNIEIVEREH